MTYANACAFLFGLERRGVRLGLDRIVGAFREHGDPQESFGAILVAGTNGKGSVTSMAASILAAAGNRTGLYTSPHLVDFRERMRVDGRMISPEEVIELTDRARASIDHWQLSFFEATTLIAFLWFRDRGVTAAGVEVGLGGRLDATRPVRTLVTVITNIGLDHVKILGETHEAIAREKAGILRAGVPLATAAAHPRARAVLRARAREAAAPIFERRSSLRTGSIRETAAGAALRLTPLLPLPGLAAPIDVEIPLIGRHQAANAALAALAAGLLPPQAGIDARAIAAGLSRARWPGRFERILSDPPVFCDVAHNAEGSRALARTLRARGIAPVRLVVGMIEGKDHAGFLRALHGCARAVHYCAPREARALPSGELARIGSGVGLEGTVHETPSEAIRSALRARAQDETILVTGSFFTVGQVWEELGLTPPDPLWDAARPDAGRRGARS